MWPKCTPAILGSPTLIAGTKVEMIASIIRPQRPIHGQDGGISLPACSSQMLIAGLNSNCLIQSSLLRGLNAGKVATSPLSPCGQIDCITSANVGIRSERGQ